MKNSIEIYKVELTTITPIHIGTGEDYVPVDYVIKGNAEGKYFFHFINRDKFIDYIMKKGKYEEFLRISNENDFMKINKFIYDNFNEELTDWKMPVSKNVFSIYNDNINGKVKKIETNRLEIRSFIYDAFKKNIYIPGSSIKGSIRTAVLNFKIKNRKNVSPYINKSKSIEVEKSILNIKEKNNSDDPFRLVKVSDFIPESNEKRYSFIDKVVNFKSGKDLSEGKGVPVFMELALRERKFIGSITIINNNLNPENINIDVIRDAMNYHYGESSYNFEYKTFQSIFNNDIINLFEKNKDEIKNNKGAFLMKIGNHSGAFEVTMEGYRKIQIKNKHNYEEPDKQTTLWAHDLNELKKYPLGWVKCKII
jgi:CRISPR-associated protein Csm5